jgi:enolase
MIKDLEISQVYNAVKERTIQIRMRTDRGTFSASAAHGTSEGTYESKELDKETIIRNFPVTKKKFIGKSEKEVDGIIQRIGVNKIGANLSIVLSIAAYRAMSNNNIYSFLDRKAHIFPYPLGNAIGGGAHKGFTSEQEFLLLPVKAKTIKEAVRTNQSVWQEVGNIIKKRGIFTGNNYEGAWMCRLSDIGTLDLLSNLAEGHGARIGIDFASSEFYDKGNYTYKNPGRKFSAGEQLDFVLDLIKTYRLAYVEDPFDESHFEHFAELTRKAKCLVTGDDLFVTNPERLRRGIKKGAGNAIIIKPDQNGLVSRTLETIRIAKKANYSPIVSHRSKDTMDSFIADLAVGTSSPVLKCGIHGKERVAKLDRLMEIWKHVHKPEMAKVF